MAINTLIPFFIVLLVGVIFSETFRKLHLPWAVALIMGGIIIGPHALGLFEPDQTVRFFAEIGLIFLMFMAGLKVSFSNFREIKKKISIFTTLNGGIPFLTGAGIILAFNYFGGFNYSWEVAALMGVIFMSSAIAVVIPSLESSGLSKTHLGRITIASTVLEDVGSLFILSVFLRMANPDTVLSLPVFYFLVAMVLIIMRWLLPKLRWLFSTGKEGDSFQQDIRTVFAILIGTVISFDLLGLHPIIAGFFAGMVLSDYITSDVLLGKLRTISYGLFIPIFFVVVGATTNIELLFEANKILLLAIIITVGSASSKLFSGWFAGRISGFNNGESLIMGSATLPQLSLTLAVAFTAKELGFIGEEIIAALILFTMTTTLLGPILLSVFIRRNAMIAPTTIPETSESPLPPAVEKEEKEEAKKFEEKIKEEERE